MVGLQCVTVICSHTLQILGCIPEDVLDDNFIGMGTLCDDTYGFLCSSY
jgi:hypothetical protein